MQFSHFMEYETHPPRSLDQAHIILISSPQHRDWVADATRPVRALFVIPPVHCVSTPCPSRCSPISPLFYQTTPLLRTSPLCSPLKHAFSPSIHHCPLPPSRTSSVWCLACLGTLLRFCADCASAIATTSADVAGVLLASPSCTLPDLHICHCHRCHRSDQQIPCFGTVL